MPADTDQCVAPETYNLPPTRFVPNSPMPVLVYRNVLPQPFNVESCQNFIEKHGWERKGPVWRGSDRRHFHRNTHECYGVISGSSKVLMGVGTSDECATGLELTLHAGDVIVHPAGTAHSNASEEGGYGFLAFFPDGSPQWKSEDGRDLLDLDDVRAETSAVPLPQDPVLGGEGKLQPLWDRALQEVGVTQ